MKKIGVRITGLLLAGALGIGCTGCQTETLRKGEELIGISKNLSDTQVFEISGQMLTLPVMQLLIVNNMSIHGESFGINLLKNNDLKVQKQFEQYIKQMTMQEITHVYCLVALAQSQEITLDEEEKQLAGWAAEEYMKTLSDGVKQQIGISQEDIIGLIERYALADKVYRALVMNVNEEVSDDEARVMRVRQIFQTNEDRAKKAREDLEAGIEFSSVAANYNEAEEINLILMRGELPTEVEQVVFSMENDTYSDLVAGADGYYVFYCENKYDEELTEIHKKDIVNQRKQQAFEEVYLPFKSGLESRLNEAVWEDVSTEELLDLQIPDFYQIYEKYMGELDLSAE